MTTDISTGRVEGNQHTTMTVYQAGGPEWVTAHLERLRATLRTDGAVLLRGMPTDAAAFDGIVQTIGGELLRYTERSTPRSAVRGNVYTSTEYPPAEAIPMHNESSYAASWPDRLYFLCATPAATGGATPIADSRAMYRSLPADLRERFAPGVTYTRVFREGLGLTWQDAFQTDDPAEVEGHCARVGEELEWLPDGLRTRHTRPAFVTEPVTGDPVWFNQANLFHVSSLDPEVGEALRELYPEDELPRNAYLADGSPIGEADLDAIARTYDEVSYAFEWQRGDVLVLNNMLCAHGRRPYTGERRILVAMTG